MFAWHGQYGQDPAVQANGADHVEEVKMAYKTPAFAKVEDMFENDTEFRQRLAVGGSSAEQDGSLNAAALCQVDVGKIVVETPKETLKRKRERARHYPAGQAQGVYEASLFRPHVVDPAS